MFRERQDKIAHGLAENVHPELVYAEFVGRYKEIDDYLKMTYEDLRGEDAGTKCNLDG